MVPGQQQDPPEREPEPTEAWPELPPVAEYRQTALFHESRMQRALSWISNLWKNRHPTVRHWIVRAVVGIIILGLLVWLFVRWRFPDKDALVTDILYYACPIPLAAFFAFLPELAKVEKMRPFVRIGIVVIGFGVSYLSYHHDHLNTLSTQGAIEAAISKANNHTDDKIDGVNKEIGDVRKDLKDGASRSDEHVSSVARNLSGEFTKSTSDLGKSFDDSLRKVGKPDPPDPVKLQFSIGVEPLPRGDHRLRRCAITPAVPSHPTHDWLTQ
jgi:hypothetical protein